APDPQNQFGSPYLAMGNMPTMGVDPDGEFFWAALPIAIKIATMVGAGAGAYAGYKIGEANGAKGLSMVGYIAGGALIGGVSGFAGGQIAGAGGAFANTLSATFSSSLNSIGMSALSGGATPISTNFGAFSLDWESGEIGFIGRDDNNVLDNVGFALGMFSLASDITAFAQGAHKSTESIQLKTDYHTEFWDSEKQKQIFSFGALEDDGSRIQTKPIKDNIGKAFKKYGNVSTKYDNGSDTKLARWVKIKGVNTEKFFQYKEAIKPYQQKYLFASFLPRQSMHCTIAGSRALLRAGVFNIPILRMPWMLDLQMRIRDYTHLSYVLNGN
ncbi:MAG: RHS repeat-associated core domain-containing protein, partial [Pseudomonadota bacterium]